MKSTLAIRLLLITLLAVGSVIALYFMFGRNLQQENGFKRNFLQVELWPKNVMEDETLYDQFIGKYNNKLYFKTLDPRTIIITDTSLTDKQLLKLNIPITENLAPAFTTTLNGEDLYILGGNVPCLIQYNLRTFRHHYFKLPFYFTKGILINKDIILLRTAQDTSGIQVLKTYNFHLGKITNESSVILDKINDGGFATDGRLLIDSISNKVYYTHYYKNQVLSFDTALKQIHKFSSIDTCFTSQIKASVRIDGHKKVYNLNAPPKYVNSIAVASDSILFICSLLKADNETYDNFSANSIIDCYSLEGKYLGSFYIPHYKGKRLISFDLKGSNLIVIYTKTVVFYKLNTHMLRKY